MLTPQDVRSVQFEKNLRGYRTEDVDHFLDKVEQQLEQDAEADGGPAQAGGRPDCRERDPAPQYAEL